MTAADWPSAEMIDAGGAELTSLGSGPAPGVGGAVQLLPLMKQA
jgi:hypothetical protein